MAVKASAQITLSYIVDVKATYRFYLLQGVTAEWPSKPTTYEPPSPWVDVEPSYTEGSTNCLYFVDCTIFNDDSFVYSEVSLSSSYEAAKQAYNKAVNAQNTANSAQEDIDNLEIGGTNLIRNTKDMDGYTGHSTVTFAREEVEGFTVATYAATESLEWRPISMLPPISYSVVRNKEVTFSMYARSDEADLYNTDTNGLYVCFALCSSENTQRSRYTAKSIASKQLSSDWTKLTFTATLTDNYISSGSLTIDDTTRFYMIIYNYSLQHVQIKKPKLEFGNRATDWSPSPDDVSGDIADAKDKADETSRDLEQAKQNLNDANLKISKLEATISTFVRDSNGESLMTQTSDGWYFSMQKYEDDANKVREDLNSLQETTGNTQETIESLQSSVNSWVETKTYVRVGEWEDEPCIELGEEGNDYSLMITNTRILFRVGSDTPTRITTYGLETDNIKVENELELGDGTRGGGSWVWIQRENGNLGLVWKAVSE